MLGNPHLCGGVIVSFDPPQILTAAHCVIDSPHPSTYTPADTNPYYAGYGHTDRRMQTIDTIADWTIHPNYATANEPQYDLAIVTMKRPMQRSAHVERAIFWPPSRQERQPEQGALIGFGYVEDDGTEPRYLQRLTLEIEQDTTGTTTIHTFAAFDATTRSACHGDSGSPLLAHALFMDPASHIATARPYVLGLLTRIFGVFDPDPTQLTCPVRLDKNAPVVQAFCNVSTVLDWLAQTTHLSIDHLTKPDADHSWLIPERSHQPSLSPFLWRLNPFLWFQGLYPALSSNYPLPGNAAATTAPSFFLCICLPVMMLSFVFF
ncbi:trypsin-like serine protease [Hesseltinella vesiculosa]|uniref:Trypsin-like serine protease n=1 Tax=Hesseltinella vesiculosa TaxID=101127 RepID=A0A1X2GFS7_9FUNG|nr:trypsin-like serine protease [Hesseltinella vesiculosa]